MQQVEQNHHQHDHSMLMLCLHETEGDIEVLEERSYMDQMQENTTLSCDRRCQQMRKSVDELAV